MKLFRKLCKLIVCGVLILESILAGICVHSTSKYTTVTSQEDYFSESTVSFTFGALQGPISNNYYFLTKLSTSSQTACRRVTMDDDIVWISAFSTTPTMNSLAIDSQEQSVYFVLGGSNFDVMKLSAISGVIEKTLRFSNLAIPNYEIKIHIASDSSGFYLISMIGSITSLCRYFFASACLCQQIPLLASRAYGQLMVSSNQFYFVGTEASPNYHLHMIKITFGNLLSDWSNKVDCSGGTCLITYSGSLLSQDSATIYSFFPFGVSGSQSLYFVSLNSSDGVVVGSRFLSSISCNAVYGIAQSDNFIAIIHYCSLYAIMLYNTVTSQFVYRKFIDYLFQISIDPIFGRFVLVGRAGNNEYISKFMPETFSTLTSLTSFTFSMDAQSSATMQIILEGGLQATSPSVSSYSITTSVVQEELNKGYYGISSYTNQTVTYNSLPNYSSTSDVCYQTDNLNIKIVEKYNISVTPDLPCSTSGSTSIVFSIANYNGETAPSWVTINSASGVLLLSAPSVSSNTDFQFYIDSTITGVASVIHKVVKVSVVKCAVANCTTCASQSDTTCIECKTGYTLSSGTCSLPSSSNTGNSNSNTSSSNSNIEPSQNAKAASTFTKSISGTTAGIAVVASFINISSFSSVWSMINQIQLFFLLLLTGGFIPQDVVTVITGMKIALFQFDFVQLQGNNIGLSIEKLDFPVNDSKLKLIEIESAIILIVSIMILHLLVLFIFKLLNRFNAINSKFKTVLAINWITTKIFLFLTFGYYIRTALESYQLLIISSISEIKCFNYSDVLHIFSQCISFCVLAFCLGIAFISIYLNFKMNHEENEHSKLGEFFLGIKDSKVSRLYVFLLQR